MFGRSYITEPDFFRHRSAGQLIVDRIEIDGFHNQRCILSVPVEKLRPFTIYDLVIRQPIPSDAKALPLYIKAIADQHFTPSVSTGYGRIDECHGVIPELSNCVDGESDCDVEVITEKVQAKMFKCCMFGYANASFANDLIYRNDEPYPFIRIYLNDLDNFVILPTCAPRSCRPKRVIVNKEIVVREPITTETLGIGRSLTPFVQPQKVESFNTYVQGNFGGHNRGLGFGW